MSTKDDENRINELIAELSDCREDERDTQNQILQVISVAGAVMSILLGTSYFGSKEGGLAYRILSSKSYRLSASAWIM